MLKTVVLNYFKGTSRTAEALGVSHSAVCQWGKIIPEGRALKAEKITAGALVYDSSLYANNGTGSEDSGIKPKS